MNDTGKNVVRLLDELKSFFKSTALLLRTADVYMEEGGWKPRSSTCVSMSYTLDGAAWWFPDHAFRFYRKDQCEHILPFVSVIFLRN